MCLHSVSPHHPYEVDEAPLRRREDESLAVPQPRLGSLLLRGVDPLEADAFGQVEEVGVAGVDHGRACL